ncbi:MAG: hypothetical protein V4485_05595 [Pseudomonadota bacterium]
MSKEKDYRDYIELSDSAPGQNIALVSAILRCNTNLDMTHDDGEFFFLSIKNNRVETTKRLIEYYETVQLPKLTVGSPEYNILRFRFKNALENAIEGRTLSEAMKNLLSEYIDFDSDERVSVRDAEIHNDEEDLSEEHNGATTEEHSTNSSLTQAIEQLPQAPALDLGVWLTGQPSANDIVDHPNDYNA